MHQSIIKVSEDIETLRFNTAISQMMVFCNELMKAPARNRAVCETFTQLLHPFAPHLAEELWAKLGYKTSLTESTWPVANPALAVENTAEVVFQVNGKVRAKAELPKDMPQAELEAYAKANERMQEFMKGMVIVKAVVVPGKLVNFVVKPG
jgi:leucyl-tRNA synthetase